MILLLHGLGGHGAEWDLVTAHLEQRGHDQGSMLTPDLRGHGRGPALAVGRSARDQLVEDAVATIDQCDLPIVVVGQSAGGIVATLTAVRRPESVKALVLVEAGMAALQSSEAAKVAQWFESWSDGFADHDAASEFFGPDAPSTPAWVAGLDASSGRLRPRFTPQTVMVILRDLAARDRWTEWQRLTTPTLIVRATSGTIADADIEAMQRQRSATVVETAPDSGHDVHLDQPAWLAKRIDSFLASLAEPN